MTRRRPMTEQPEQPRSRTRFDCRECGMSVEGAEFHPYWHCVLFKNGVDPRRLEPIPEQREAVRLIAKGSYFVNGECRWCGFTDTEGHEQQCAVTIARAALAGEGKKK